MLLKNLQHMKQFQSTLPRGSDCPILNCIGDDRKFQSTLPRGSDKYNRIAGTKAKRFQSTLPRGSDAKALVIDCKRLISIHAPSRERPRLV